MCKTSGNIKRSQMNNDIQNFTEENEREKINLYVEVSLVTFFVTIILFSALVLIG
jgi:hypothetical protein